MDAKTIQMINTLKEALNEDGDILPVGVQRELPLKYFPARRELITQLDAVVYHFQLMDADMIDDLIDDDAVFSELFTRTAFRLQLQKAFDEFSKSGDTYLEAIDGFCQDMQCNYLKKGFRFVGNLSQNWMDIIFEHEHGRLKEIYQCHHFCQNKDASQSGKQILLEIYSPFDKADDLS